MMGNEGISVADAIALRNSGENGNGWGGDGGWWILLLFILLGGWNNNGNGGGFGGGFGRMREVCGAVSGMVAVLSAAHGYAYPEDNAGNIL